MTIDNILQSKPIQATGRTAFVLGFIGTLINYITQMELIQPIILIVSGMLGIIFVIYKIMVIRIQYIEANERRINTGLQPITWKFWKHGKNRIQKNNQK